MLSRGVRQTMKKSKIEIEKKSKISSQQCRSRGDGTYEPSPLDLHCLARPFFRYVVLKGLKGTVILTARESVTQALNIPRNQP